MNAHWFDVASSPSAQALGTQGAFVQAIEQFKPRLIQQTLTAAVEATFKANGVLIAESGTGTGKTYAYLVPALLSGQRVILSTGTKHLQDQLFNRDLPRVCEVLGLTVDTALLKGRSNYLCTWRLGEFPHSETFHYQREAQKKWEIIQQWSLQTRDGETSEVREFDESDPFWREVTSTADNCLGAECPHYKDCYVNKARQRAIKANIVVVNHHLFFSDLALKEQGFGELLPEHDAVVFDEAHQVPDIASVFFGFNFSTFQLKELLRDTLVADAKEQSGVDLQTATQSVKTSLNHVDLAFSQAAKGEAKDVVVHPKRLEALNNLLDELADFETLLSQASHAGESLQRCHQRTLTVQNQLLQWIESGARQSKTYIGWYESTARNTRFHATPLSVSERFNQLLFENNKAWVFTSATLAAGQDFSLFQHKIGASDAHTLQLDSPFDYARQTKLYLPEHLPEPNQRHFADALLQAVTPVLEASQGHAFFLFTSYQMLHQMEQKLRALQRWDLMVQGEAPRAELIERFINSSQGILLGTSSFWEGVDIKGEALSCVIIDKLPFVPPNDPVMRTRSEHYQANGGNAFMDLQVAEAIIALKQGAGRLIRDEKDTGVLMLCDARLRTKRYGKAFLEALPPMPITHNIEEVRAFFT